MLLLRQVVVLCLGIIVLCAASEKLDFKLVTAVRHGLERSLGYIEENLYRSNVDCLLGVAFLRAFLRTSYKNGSHVMDNSTLRLLNKCNQIIQNGRRRFANDLSNGNYWKYESLIQADIWTKSVNYLNHGLSPSWIHPSDNSKVTPDNITNSDICLQEIIDNTDPSQVVYTPCIITVNCWNDFFRNWNGRGYYLTHKLLLLQIAKARKCLMSEAFYDLQVNNICSSIMAEIIQNNNYGELARLFDLFLEQVLLCGYEGFSEFIQNNWLFHVIKSQQLTGCFSDDLTDNLKTRIKKDVTYFEDGCNDHTTGLGTAVLGLYYNYIINEVEPQTELDYI